MFEMAAAGLQLDGHPVPVREAAGRHGGVLGQRGVHPGRLAALPHQADGLLQRAEGQLVLQAGAPHLPGQPVRVRLAGQDLHLGGLRSG